jgi:phosphoglycerate dehydrogenase-like enzyme
MNRLRIYVDLAMPPGVRELLEGQAAAHELMFPPKSPGLSGDDPDPQFSNADVAFGQPDLRAIAEATHLKWIHVSSSGITRYDTPEFRAQMARRQIVVSNSASVFQEPCAVHALSFMLAQTRKLPCALVARRPIDLDESNQLRQLSGTLRGENLLIVGFGAIGARLAELLQPFGMNVTGYRRHPRGDGSIRVIALEGLEASLACADHVMNILPDSRETRLFFDQKRFGSMKRGAVFYNIGRGATVDQSALNDALRSGNLSAAWLDVTEPEPLPEDHFLWKARNCFITPHTAGGHANETVTLVRHFLDNLDRFVHGLPLRDRVM